MGKILIRKNKFYKGDGLMNSEKSLRKYWLVLAIVLIVAAISIYFISKSNKIDYARVSKEMKDFASLEEPSIDKFVKKGYVDITEPLEHDAGIDLRNSLGGPSVYVKTVRVDDSGTYYGTIYWKNRDCLLYTSPSPRDISGSRMPSSA